MNMNGIGWENGDGKDIVRKGEKAWQEGSTYKKWLRSAPHIIRLAVFRPIVGAFWIWARVFFSAARNSKIDFERETICINKRRERRKRRGTKGLGTNDRWITYWLRTTSTRRWPWIINNEGETTNKSGRRWRTNWQSLRWNWRRLMTTNLGASRRHRKSRRAVAATTDLRRIPRLRHRRDGLIRHRRRDADVEDDARAVPGRGYDRNSRFYWTDYRACRETRKWTEVSSTSCVCINWPKARFCWEVWRWPKRD